QPPPEHVARTVSPRPGPATWREAFPEPDRSGRTTVRPDGIASAERDAECLTPEGSNAVREGWLSEEHPATSPTANATATAPASTRTVSTSTRREGVLLHRGSAPLQRQLGRSEGLH